MITKKIIEVEEIPTNPKMGDCFVIKGVGISDHTHGIFKYPCKFIPHIPRWFISKYSNSLTKDYGILDPFMGSGTSLVESSLLGFKSYGVDIDPLSKLLSKVKTTKLTLDEISILKKSISDIRARIKLKVPVKKLASYKPKFKNIEYWFSSQAIIDLTLLKYLITEQFNENKSQKILDVLQVTLASIIRKASLADEQSPKPYISSRIIKKRIDIFSLFLSNAEKNIISISAFSKSTKIKQTKIVGYDARKIEKKGIAKQQIHLAITSPPYINAFDYVRSLKLENYWLFDISDKEISDLQDLQIGTEKISLRTGKIIKFNIDLLDESIKKIELLDKKRAFIVSAFFESMNSNLASVYNLLIKDGYYCIVVGNSVIRGINISTSDFLIELAKKNKFKFVLNFSYVIRNRYLRIPRSGRGGFIPSDHILVFKK